MPLVISPYVQRMFRGPTYEMECSKKDTCPDPVITSSREQQFGSNLLSFSGTEIVHQRQPFFNEDGLVMC